MKIKIYLFNNKIGYQVSEIHSPKEYFLSKVQIILMCKINQQPSNQGKAKYRIFKILIRLFLLYMITLIIRVKRWFLLHQLNLIIQYGSIKCLKKYKLRKMQNINHKPTKYYKNSKLFETFKIINLNG